MSKTVLENFPAWMQTYLRGIVQVHRVDAEVAVWSRSVIKWAFDLLKNAMVVGVLQYWHSKAGALC